MSNRSEQMTHSDRFTIRILEAQLEHLEDTVTSMIISEPINSYDASARLDCLQKISAKAKESQALLEKYKESMEAAA
jgi:hypothetical protein